MWADVSQQLAGILKKAVFECLLQTPSYTAFLRQGGLMPPFSEYVKQYRPAFPASYSGTCDTYAHLITSQVRQLNCLADDNTLRADVIRGPISLFRVMHSRNKGPESPDLRRGTAYMGDWWFGQDLLDDCIRYCRALEQERLRNPLLTDMTPDRCLRTQLRRRLAIRIDWNAIEALRKLVLAPNEAIPVITGVGLPMRIHSIDADWREFPDKSLPVARQQLPGGDRQIWTPWTPQKAIQL